MDQQFRVGKFRSICDHDFCEGELVILKFLLFKKRKKSQDRDVFFSPGTLLNHLAEVSNSTGFTLHRIHLIFYWLSWLDVPGLKWMDQRWTEQWIYNTNICPIYKQVIITNPLILINHWSIHFRDIPFVGASSTLPKLFSSKNCESIHPSSPIHRFTSLRSLGIILYQMVYGHPPFARTPKTEVWGVSMGFWFRGSRELSKNKRMGSQR